MASCVLVKFDQIWIRFASDLVAWHGTRQTGRLTFLDIFRVSKKAWKMRCKKRGPDVENAGPWLPKGDQNEAKSDPNLKKRLNLTATGNVYEIASKLMSPDNARKHFRLHGSAFQQYGTGSKKGHKWAPKSTKIEAKSCKKSFWRSPEIRLEKESST